MGFAKTGGNYAASLIGQQKAEEMGYAQVLWLDGIEHKYIDEVGAMNVFSSSTAKSSRLAGGQHPPRRDARVGHRLSQRRRGLQGDRAPHLD